MLWMLYCCDCCFYQCQYTHMRVCSACWMSHWWSFPGSIPGHWQMLRCRSAPATTLHRCPGPHRWMWREVARRLVACCRAIAAVKERCHQPPPLFQCATQPVQQVVGWSQFAAETQGLKWQVQLFFFDKIVSTMSPWYQFTASSSHCLTIIYVFILFRALH